MFSAVSIRRALRVQPRTLKSMALSSRSFSSTPQGVGFIGLGNMGGHMANNLLKAGHNVFVFDVNTAALQVAEKNGATVCSSPKEVAKECRQIVTMLPAAAHVKAVYAGDNGIFESVAEGSLLIDSSTIDPASTREVAAAAKLLGADMADAPVSGGVGGAEAGTLTFMVGAEDAVFTRAEGLLKAMGKNIVHCGANGTGQVAKIANNLVLAISMIGVSEGMNLGAKLGMDPKKLASIFNTSTARCWSSDTYNPYPGVMEGVPSSRGYTGGFGVDLMKKDLGLAVSAAAQENVNLPVGAIAHQLYNLHSSHGSGAKDFSSIIEWIAGQSKK